MDIKKGILEIDTDLRIEDTYTLQDFKRSIYFTGQDLSRIIFLDKKCRVQNHTFSISFFFKGEILYMIGLVCMDREFAPENEKDRKKYHDTILESWGLQDKNRFAWGSIASEYDSKSNISSINMIYK